MAKRDYIEFQARTSPLAYLITFRTYGTWLHGDERGSMDRRFHNRVGDAKIKPSAGLEKYAASLLKQAPVILDSSQRKAVEAAVKEVCGFRGYCLQAINVRTNHVHTVVSASVKPELVTGSFKSYATRRLRTDGLLPVEIEPWSRHGSNLYLWTEEEVDNAINYVLYGQDGERFEKLVNDSPIANDQ